MLLNINSIRKSIDRRIDFVFRVTAAKANRSQGRSLLSTFLSVIRPQCATGSDAVVGGCGKGEDILQPAILQDLVVGH